jgi:uncharacterized protein
MSQTKRSRSTPTSDALAFSVTGLLAEPAGTRRELEVSVPPIDLGPELRQSRGVEGRLKLTRTNRGLLVEGRFDTELRLVCSRCLREIDYPIGFEIEEEALPSVDLVSGLALDTSTEPDQLRLNDHHELELEGEFRDAIVLAEPIAPLCREDCPGLCQVCGKELAGGNHDHPDAEIDPRLEVLRAFREEDRD